MRGARHPSSGEFLTEPSTRRDLLRQTGAAAAALAIPVGVYSARQCKPVRIGLVGGNFGCSFQFHEHPDCIVHAVSDLRPERLHRLAQVYRCNNTYPSLEELVRDDQIDAVGLFTDAPLHVDQAVLCMKHGKHVLSAVPACVGSLEDARRLVQTVEETGLTYMMAETSYYQQPTISARKFFQQGRFGELYFCEAVYQHDGLQGLFFENGRRTWRHGYPPLLYPTHCTAMLIGVTGERLTEVTCHGWGDDDPILQDNQYNNPFWNGSALFRTDRGHAMDCQVWWKGAHRGAERAEWIGTEMSFYGPQPNGQGPMILRSGKGLTEQDDAGFVRNLPQMEPYEQPRWWETEMLPEPLRHDSGHFGSHTFLTHEFVDALVRPRRPAIDVYEAVAYTVPGIVAHQSALAGGQQMKIPQFDRPAG